VVMHILLEKGVICLDARNAPSPGSAHSGIVRHEGCLDMDEVEIHRLQRLERTSEGAPPQPAVLGILGNTSGRHANQSLLAGLRLPLVFGSDQQCLDSTARQILPKGSDGGGDAVDPWKIDVRDEKDAHEVPSVSTQRQAEYAE